MLKAILNFIKGCARSCLGQLLFAIHLILFVYAVAYWHAHPETRVDSSFFSNLIDILKILGTPILYPVVLIARNTLLPTKVNETIISVIVSLQWWVIGYLIESIITRIRGRGAR
jgi:hypothetical protein